VLSLIPLADSVTKLTALCRQCGDGTAAIFTLRRPPLPAEAVEAITENQEQIQVGGAEQYESVCRRHFTE
jgi:thymidine kinase